MIERLALRHPAGETRLVAGRGALVEAREHLAEWARGRTVFVVTSPRIRELHGERLAWIEGTAGRLVTLEVEEGEAAKTVAGAERLWREMLAAGGKRDSRLVAFGGGSVGDLGGFAAGCFLRGIAVAQVPTTLLAQVDAAIGGKTAVDLPGGKNSVGVFHHPDLVVAETELLATLPPRELRSGLIEVVKMALLLDADLLARVEADLDLLLAGEPAALGPVVAAAAAAKIGVVERDPTERGERRLLNFGHTLGHAIESCLGYRHLRHGEAVAYGLLFALLLAERRGLPPAVGERMRALLGRCDLPPLPPLEVPALLAAMARDKKARESGLVWVLPVARAGGEVVGEAVGGIPPAEVSRELEAFLAHPFAAARG